MIRHLLSLSLIALVSTITHAADKDVEVLLEKMRKVYGGTNSAHIVVKTTSLRFGEQVITSDLTYVKPRKISAKVFNLPSLKGKTWSFISDGKDVAIDDLSGNAQRSKFDLDLIPIPINLEAMAFWDWERQLSTGPGSNMEHSKFKLIKSESWNGKPWIVLEETAFGQNVFVRYFVSPTTSLINRVLVYDLQKKTKRIETVVTKLERNIKVNPAIFKIRVTPGGNRIKFERKID